MSDTANLSINISARDTAAAQIRGLQATIRDLEKEIRRASQTGLDSGGAYTSVLQKQSDAIREQIAALQGQAAAVREVTAATVAQGDAAAVVRRTLQQNIDVSLGIGSDRAINSAAASARVLATSLSAAAEADARLRDSEVGTAAATRAATDAMAAQGRAAVASGLEQDVGAGAAGGSGMLNREARHVVGLFDSLARGQKGQAFSSIGAAARDAGMGVAGLATSIGALVAVMGTVAVLRHAAGLGKWAEEMRAGAGATGMSVSQFSALSAALQQLGFSGNEADSSMRRMARSLSTAISQPASLAAEAFHNLGISQAQLAANGNNVDGALHMLADAYVRTADGATKTANMEEILGRAFQQLIPLLQEGSAGLDKMTNKQKELGTTIDKDGAAKLAKMGNAVRELGTAIHGDGIGAMKAWSGVIIGLAHSLEGLGTVLGFVLDKLGLFASSMVTGNDIYDPALTKKLRDYDKHPNSSLTGAFVGAYEPPFTPSPDAAAAKTTAAKVAVPALTPPTSPLEAMRLHMAQATATAAHGTGTMQQVRQAEAQAAITAMQHTLQTAQLTAQQRTQIETELAQRQTELSNETRSAQEEASRRVTTAGAKAAKQSYADFASAEKLKISAASGAFSQIVGVYNQWLSEAEGRYRQSASVIEGIERQKMQTINTERLREIKQGAQTAETVGHARSVIAGAQADVAKHQGGAHVSAAQTIGNLAAQSQQIQAQAKAEVNSLVQVMNTAQKGSTTQQQAAQEILSVVTRAKQQEIALYDKAAAAAHEAAQKMTAPFKHMFDQLGSQFTSLSDSLVKDLLAPKIDFIKQGLTTLKISEGGTQIHQVLRQFALNLVTDATNTLTTTLSKFAASSLSGLLNIPLAAGGSGMSALFSGGLDKLFGMGGQAVGGVTKGLNAAQFGLATTQLQTASMTLQTAALALQTSATASGASSATGAGAAGAATMTTALAPVTAAVTAGTVEQTTAQATNTATTTATATANTAAIVSAIATQSAVTQAGLLAVALKPSVLGFSAAGGMVVPSMAGGGTVNDGKGGTLAVLHPQEMVLPAHLSRGVQGMINQGGQGNGGNHANLHYSPTINMSSRGRQGTGMTRAEFSQTMASHGGRMMGEARNMVRAGWRPG